MYKRAIIAAAAGSLAFAAPVAAQTQNGLVNVNLSSIQTTLQNILSNNNVAVNVPVTASVPIGIAAKLCNIDVNVLAAQKGDRKCDGAVAGATNQNAMALSRFLNTQHH